MQHPPYPTIEDTVGRTPLVALQRIGAQESAARGNVILAKLEGNNPAGSVKDRPAVSMIRRAEERGEIQPGDTLIEATSGNTGIALAMAAAIKGYRMVLIMPEDLSIERAQTMKAFGAELILTPKSGGMEYARDLAENMQGEGKGRMLDQFANADNPRIHYETTGPELWGQTGGRITHFVSAMGTTGTITGVSRFLKEKNPAIRIVGAQPSEGSRIPGIRKWPTEYLPKIYDPSQVDELVYVSQGDAEDMCRRLAREEGIFGGISAAGACWVAQQIAQQVENATIVFVVCDRGDRYLSTGVFPAGTGERRVPFLPLLRLAAGAHGRRGGRRFQGAAALPGLRLHPLEQPHARARGHRSGR
jgi:cysteine synthase B